jgi:hypothetical protein
MDGELSLLYWSCSYGWGALLSRWSSSYGWGVLPIIVELFPWMGSSPYRFGALIYGWGALPITVELFLWMESSPYHVLFLFSQIPSLFLHDIIFKFDFLYVDSRKRHCNLVALRGGLHE